MITAANTRLFYYSDNWQVLNEFDSAGTTCKAMYVYGNYIDEVLYTENTTGTTGDYFYLHDHLYSPAALIEDNLDGTGTVKERYEYDAYGKATIYDGTWSQTYAATLCANPYLYTGRRLDTLDGGLKEIMYYRNRYYDTYTGRMYTPDPLEYFDGMNLYNYASSSPIVNIDWNGYASVSVATVKTKEEALKDCNKTLDYLKSLMKGGQGAMGLFYKCAVKKGCLEYKNIKCEFKPMSTGAVYNKDDLSIILNATLYKYPHLKKKYNAFNLMVHELTHAADCKNTFNKDRCLDTMIREARAYWRGGRAISKANTDKTCCKTACEDAWGSAKKNCFHFEVFNPAWEKWFAGYEKSKNKEDYPAFNRPIYTEAWAEKNKDKWIKKCKDMCGKGPLTHNRQIDQECQKTLSKNKESCK